MFLSHGVVFLWRGEHWSALPLQWKKKLSSKTRANSLILRHLYPRKLVCIHSFSAWHILTEREVILQDTDNMSKWMLGLHELFIEAWKNNKNEYLSITSDFLLFVSLGITSSTDNSVMFICPQRQSQFVPTLSSRVMDSKWVYHLSWMLFAEASLRKGWEIMEWEVMFSDLKRGKNCDPLSGLKHNDRDETSGWRIYPST